MKRLILLLAVDWAEDSLEAFGGSVVKYWHPDI